MQNDRLSLPPPPPPVATLRNSESASWISISVQTPNLGTKHSSSNYRKGSQGRIRDLLTEGPTYLHIVFGKNCVKEKVNKKTTPALGWVSPLGNPGSATGTPQEEGGGIYNFIKIKGGSSVKKKSGTEMRCLEVRIP